MITSHFHLHPQFLYELFHILYIISLFVVFARTMKSICYDLIKTRGKTTRAPKVNYWTFVVNHFEYTYCNYRNLAVFIVSSVLL